MGKFARLESLLFLLLFGSGVNANICPGSLVSGPVPTERAQPNMSPLSQCMSAQPGLAAARTSSVEHVVINARCSLRYEADQHTVVPDCRCITIAQTTRTQISSSLVPTPAVAVMSSRREFVVKH